jgi:hypothetical protein
MRGIVELRSAFRVCIGFGYRKDFFLLFPFWMFLIYMRGVLTEFSQLGGPARRRERPRDDAPDAKVETHCMELMLQVCLGTGHADLSGDSVLPAPSRCLLEATMLARTLQ